MSVSTNPTDDDDDDDLTPWEQLQVSATYYQMRGLRRPVNTIHDMLMERAAHHYVRKQRGPSPTD